MDFSWFYDINNWGPYAPAIIGVVIGGWLILKKTRQMHCTSKTEGIITGTREIVTETTSSLYDPNVHSSRERERYTTRETEWQASYRFEADGKTYNAVANKHREIRFKQGDAVTVNYNANNPSQSFIEQDRVKSSYGWIFIIGGVLVSALFIVVPKILNI